MLPFGSISRPVVIALAMLLLLSAAVVTWWLAGPGTSSAVLTTASRQSDSEVFAQYAGSKSCRECHAEAYDLWRHSNHGLAERAIDLEIDREAFDPPRRFEHGSQTSEARFEDGACILVTTGADGEEAFHPEGVIGVYPLRQFLIPDGNGRVQVSEVAFDPKEREWFNVYGEEDRQPGEWGHWSGRGMTWNTMCATCHNTRVRKNYDSVNDRFHTVMAERSVGCEACHGPMRAHVEWQRARGRSERKDPTLRQFNREQFSDTCGACHARRSDLTGDFHPGELFLDHHGLILPDETEVYFPDGQVHEENFEFTAFLGSRMHAAGVRCVDCHDPHSARIRMPGDLLCMSCHGGQQPKVPAINVFEHTFHPPGKPGSRCVDCHMPQTVYMERHPRHDHGFTIPDPLLTKLHGIPNACNRCHTDQSVDWALEHVDLWYGEKMDRPERQRARVIAAAREGDPEAGRKLLELSREEKNAMWRAVACGLMKHWGDDPLVRAMAARALESALARPQVTSTLEKLAQDPVRAVRIEAAWGLRNHLDTNSTAGLDLLRFIEFNLDQPSGRLQMGTFELDRGNVFEAIAHFRRAIQWDKNSPPLHHALAVALSISGNAAEAVRALEAACELSPEDAGYRFRLALALNEAGRWADATQALEKAVELDPRLARAWYNLGLAYAAEERLSEALTALERAEAVEAGNPEFPYARATVLARLGMMHEAREASRRALEIDPGFTPASQLLRGISGAPGSR